LKCIKHKPFKPEKHCCLAAGTETWSGGAEIDREEANKL